MTALYRHYDASGALLYVGIAVNPLHRTKAHEIGAHWFRQVWRIDLQWFETREAAEAAEAEAITKERPLHNRRHAVIEGGVAGILSQWPSRRAVLEDARAADPDLEMVAVHRWFQRGSVPARHWSALMAGAKRRKLGVSIHDLAFAHADPSHTTQPVRAAE